MDKKIQKKALLAGATVGIGLGTAAIISKLNKKEKLHDDSFLISEPEPMEISTPESGPMEPGPMEISTPESGPMEPIVTPSPITPEPIIPPPIVTPKPKVLFNPFIPKPIVIPTPIVTPTPIISPTWEKFQQDELIENENFLSKIFGSSETSRQKYLEKYNINNYTLPCAIVKSATNAKKNPLVGCFGELIIPIGLVPLKCDNVWRQLQIEFEKDKDHTQLDDYVFSDTVVTLLDTKIQKRKFETNFPTVIVPIFRLLKNNSTCYIYLDNFENLSKIDQEEYKMNNKNINTENIGICFVNTGMNILRHIILTSDIDLSKIYTKEILKSDPDIILLFDAIFNGDDISYKKLLINLREKYSSETYIINNNTHLNYFDYRGGVTSYNAIKLLDILKLNDIFNDQFLIQSDLKQNWSNLQIPKDYTAIGGDIFIPTHSIYYNIEYKYISNDGVKIPVVRLNNFYFNNTIYRKTKQDDIIIEDLFGKFFYNINEYKIPTYSGARSRLPPLLHIKQFIGSSPEVTFSTSSIYFPILEQKFRRVPKSIFEMFDNTMTLTIDGINAIGIFKNKTHSFEIDTFRFNALDQNETTKQEYYFIEFEWKNIPLIIQIMREACLLTHFFNNNFGIQTSVWKPEYIKKNMKYHESKLSNEEILKNYKMENMIEFCNDKKLSFGSDQKDFVYIGMYWRKEKVLFLEHNNTLITKNPDNYIPAFRTDRLLKKDAKYVYCKRIIE
jgi:hypothetical protein